MLNPAQWAALRFFSQAGQAERTSSEFAKFHQTTRGTANQTVLALLRRGYLDRQRSISDQRSKVVSLTQKGREALSYDPMLHLQNAVGALDLADQDKLDALLRAVHQGMLDIQSKAETESVVEAQETAA